LFTYGGPDTTEQVNEFDVTNKMVETLLELTLNRGWPHWFKSGIEIGYARGHLVQIMTMCGIGDLICTF